MWLTSTSLIYSNLAPKFHASIRKLFSSQALKLVPRPIFSLNVILFFLIKPRSAIISIELICSRFSFLILLVFLYFLNVDSQSFIYVFIYKLYIVIQEPYEISFRNQNSLVSTFTEPNAIKNFYIN